MVRIFDEEDYRRRLDQAGEISTSDEAALVLKGALMGTGFAPLNAQQNILEAKQNALIRARKEMIRAIRAEDDRVQNGAIIPIDVQEIVTGRQGDELVKVP